MTALACLATLGLLCYLAPGAWILKAAVIALVAVICTLVKYAPNA